MPIDKETIRRAAQEFNNTFFRVRDEQRQQEQFDFQRRAQEFTQQMQQRQDARSEAEAGRAAEEHPYRMQQLDALREQAVLQAEEMRNTADAARKFFEDFAMTPEEWKLRSEVEKEEIYMQNQKASIAYTKVLSEAASIQAEIERRTKEFVIGAREQDYERSGIDLERARVDRDVAKETKFSRILSSQSEARRNYSDANVSEATEGNMIRNSKAILDNNLVGVKKAREELKEAKRKNTNADLAQGMMELDDGLSVLEERMNRMNRMVADSASAEPGGNARLKDQYNQLLDETMPIYNQLNQQMGGVLQQRFGVKLEAPASKPSTRPLADAPWWRPGAKFEEVERKRWEKDTMRVKKYNWLEVNRNGQLVQNGSDDEAEFRAAAVQPYFGSVLPPEEVKPERYGQQYEDPELSLGNVIQSIGGRPWGKLPSALDKKTKAPDVAEVLWPELERRAPRIWPTP